MIVREPGCRACEATTSGDCSAHGPRILQIVWPPIRGTTRLPQSVIDQIPRQATSAP